MTHARSSLPPVATPPAPDSALVAALERVIPHYHRVLRRALTAVEGEERLLFPQLRCLQAIAQSGESVYAAQLARTLLVTPPTMTRTLDALVERGLVERQPDPANRRQVTVVLTQDGRTLVARYETAIISHLQGLIAPLPAARQERLLLALQDLEALLADESGLAGAA